MADFIRVEVIEGIQRLYTLRLSGAPPEDGILVTVNVWIDVLTKKFKTWTTQDDQGRIRKGFDGLILEVTRWPSPAMLIDHIPARKEKLKIGYRPKFTEEEISRNQKEIRKIITNLTPLKDMKNDQT